MNLVFQSETDAWEYIEVNTKRNHHPFVYNKKDKHDMIEYNELYSEYQQVRSFNCDIGGQPFVMGSYCV